MRSQLSTVGLHARAIGVLFRKSFPVPVSQAASLLPPLSDSAKIERGETPQNSFHEVSITKTQTRLRPKFFKKGKITA